MSQINNLPQKYLFDIKVDNIQNTDNDWNVYSSYYRFSAVLMVMQEPISLKNDHFNLKRI